MKRTPFSNSCNPASKKFFEDFDLLPKEVKEILWNSAKPPTFEDLKAAWELAGESFSIEKLKQTLNVFEEERKEAKKKRREDKLKQARLEKVERNNRRREKYRKTTFVPVYKTVRNDKHGRLVERVKLEEAVKMLSNRKEVKEIRPAGTYQVLVGWKEVKKEPDPLKEPPKKEEPVLHITKQFHNS